MIVRVEIGLKPDGFDARGAEIVHQAATVGVAVAGAAVQDLVFLSGPSLTAAEIDRVVRTLLLDPVVADAAVVAMPAAYERIPGARIIEVAPRPGVTDSPAESLLAAARELGVAGLEAVATGRRVVLRGVDDAAVDRLARALLANEVVEELVIDGLVEPPFVQGARRDLTVDRIALRGLDDEGLMALSRERRLSLDVVEMRAVQGIFEAEQRDPTDAELEMFAQTWSEHCVHKTF